MQDELGEVTGIVHGKEEAGKANEATEANLKDGEIIVRMGTKSFYRIISG